MKTEEALLEMLSERGIFKKLGVSKSTVHNYKTFLKNKLDGSDVSAHPGRISIDKMEELLERGGYRVVQEKQWQKL